MLKSEIMYKLLCLLLAYFCIATANEGRRFLLSFPPEKDLLSDGKCIILINSQYTAEISLSYHDMTTEFAMDAGSYEYNITCAIRAQLGHSNDAVLVESNVDISVQVFMEFDDMGDAFLARPLRDDGNEYVLASWTPCSWSTYLKSVFTVAALRDDTVFRVYAPVAGGYELVDTLHLDSFDTFTNGSYSNLDFTGWKVASDSPISVVSGSSCYRAGCFEDAGYLFTPSIDKAGHQFIVPRVADYRNQMGSFIRVISLSENNFVQLPDQLMVANLSSGEYFEYEYDNLIDYITIICNAPCIVILSNECTSIENGYLINVPALERRVDSAQFTAVQDTNRGRNYDNRLAIVASTQNILVDGQPIEGWRWVPRFSYYDAHMAITAGRHTIITNDGGMFLAVVYGVAGFHSYGSEIAYTADELPVLTTASPITTTGSPDFPVQTPIYKISLISDWVSEEDMEIQCVGSYSAELRTESLQMVVHINNEIGASLCIGYARQDIHIASTSTSFFASISTGNAFVVFILHAEDYVTLADIRNCANEITAFVRPHGNWGLPLLNPLPNCAFPVFEDAVFYDGNHEWVCEYDDQSSIPSFKIRLIGLGTTDNQSDLTPDCAFRYSESLESRALSMRAQVNSMIGSVLCSDTTGISVATYLSSFTGQGNTALAVIDYVLTYGSHASGAEALSCAEEVWTYLVKYSNWGLPLLPPDPSCPEMVFHGEEFDESSHSWICNI